MAEIQLERVTKVYPDGTRAVAELDMTVADGELVVFVGPSGCGKTSALRMIAGLEDITDGTIRIGSEVVNDLPPKDRDVAMVFQNYALYPHMTAEDNMAFALRMRGLSKEERRRRVHEAARLLGLSDVLRKRPRTLSGGQRQRVAMGRAIVREPQAFLMDEPLSNLDAKLRVQMRAEIARIQRDLNVTTIYVTHDQSEAMTLGDRVAVMRKGELQQLDSPQRLYGEPVNLFVAEFIGSPAMNLVVADVVRDDGGVAVRFGDHRLRVPDTLTAARPGLAAYAGRRIALGMRPEDLEDAALVPEASEDETFDAVVDIREDMGSEIYLHFAVPAEPVATEDVREAVESEAVEAQREAARRHGDPFVARVARESRVREHEHVRIHVRTDRLHFFDLETGAGVYA
ncbi:MAG: ABC transporter ATP-binding protein [Pseudomonadota bacterium]